MHKGGSVDAGGQREREKIYLKSLDLNINKLTASNIYTFMNCSNLGFPHRTSIVPRHLAKFILNVLYFLYMY